MKSSQWLLFGMGSVISGVTVWYALNGDLPAELPRIITGTLLAIVCFVWGFVGLEERKERDQWDR